MDRQLISLSKFLSLVLRHHPETIGIQLDQNGCTNISDLIEATSRHGRQLDHTLLMRVVHENDKQRFAISEDGRRIRANQGHSIEVDLDLTSQAPPQVLYHGTVRRFLTGIQREGLVPGRRQYVHLSPDERTAHLVGKRRGKPIVLRIRAQQMATAGTPFFLSRNGVWLTAHVPPEYIEFPQP